MSTENIWFVAADITGGGPFSPRVYITGHTLASPIHSLAEWETSFLFYK